MSTNRLFVLCLGLALVSASFALVGEAAATDEGREVPASQGDLAEKEAFNSAKELGTIEGWEAFLSHFPGGFRADLARAYVRQLGLRPAAVPLNNPAAPTPYPVAGTNLQPARERSCTEQSTISSSNSNTPAKITFINNSGMYRSILWIDFKGRTKSYANLNAGEQITLDTFLTHPWLITDGPGNCVKLVLPEPGASVAYLEGSGRAEPSHTYKKTEPTYFTTRPKKVSSSCGSGKIKIDGKCMRKADAAGYCGPGYRPQGGKCVQGYRAPKASDGVPSWQKEAIKKGCPAGMAWNAAEGCHEND